MKLLLTSAGITNKTIEKAFRGLVNHPFDQLKLAFIPTAANVEPGDKRWMIDDLTRLSDLGFSAIDIVDISAVPRDVWNPRLLDSDVLVFGGGNTFHLMYWLEKSGLKRELPKMLQSKVYVGISAGSMVTTKNLTLSDSEALYSEEIGNVSVVNGLGFVEFTIRPHLNSDFFTKVRLPLIEKISRNISEMLYAIDDDTAIVIEDKKLFIVSEGKWKKFN